MNADNRQKNNTATLPQEKIKNTDSMDSNVKALDNEQLDEINGGLYITIVNSLKDSAKEKKS